MILPITLVIAGASGLIAAWLGVRVTLLRRVRRVSIGDGGSEELATRVRIHANFIEYTPIFLILLGLVEAAGGSRTWLWAVSILFILGRLLHPLGMVRPAPNALRIAAMSLTWTMLLILAGASLYFGYSAFLKPAITYA